MSVIGASGTVEIDLGAGWLFAANIRKYQLNIQSESLESTRQGDAFKSFRGDGIISGSGSIDYFAEFDSRSIEITAKQLIGFSVATGINKEAKARFTIVAGDPAEGETSVYIDSKIVLEGTIIDTEPKALVACSSDFKCSGPLRFVCLGPGSATEDLDYCVAIVEESLTRPEDLTALWEKFRTKWPDRRFAILVLSDQGENLITTEVDAPVSIDVPWDGLFRGISASSDLAGIINLSTSPGNARVWIDGAIEIETIYDSIATLMQKASLAGRSVTVDYYIADSYIEPFLD